MNDFFETVRKFLIEYLPNQRCLSENTIRSYRQILNLFVKFLREVKGYTVAKIRFPVINREMLLEFFDWIEIERKCSASTRNQRLMVLRAFFDYAGIIDCTQTSLYMDILRTCSHRICVRIFEHNFHADKEKDRRNTVVLQGFLTKFSMKICQKYVRVSL